MKAMALWDGFKKRFDRWDGKVSEALEGALRNQLILEPAAQLVTTAAKGFRRFNRLREGALGTLGLATKNDQERTLHLLNELNSRIVDLEEKLDDAKAARTTQGDQP